MLEHSVLYVVDENCLSLIILKTGHEHALGHKSTI